MTLTLKSTEPTVQLSYPSFYASCGTISNDCTLGSLYCGRKKISNIEFVIPTTHIGNDDAFPGQWGMVKIGVEFLCLVAISLSLRAVARPISRSNTRTISVVRRTTLGSASELKVVEFLDGIIIVRHRHSCHMRRYRYTFLTSLFYLLHIHFHLSSVGTHCKA